MVSDAVPPLILKTAANPAGLPMEVSMAFANGVLADRSPSSSKSERAFYGANAFRRPPFSQGVMDSFWLQGMQAGSRPRVDAFKAVLSSLQRRISRHLKKIDVPTLILSRKMTTQIVPIGRRRLCFPSKLVKGNAEGFLPDSTRPCARRTKS